jgi:hypothetical protein
METAQRDSLRLRNSRPLPRRTVGTNTRIVHGVLEDWIFPARQFELWYAPLNPFKTFHLAAMPESLAAFSFLKATNRGTFQRSMCEKPLLARVSMRGTSPFESKAPVLCRSSRTSHPAEVRLIGNANFDTQSTVPFVGYQKDEHFPRPIAEGFRKVGKFFVAFPCEHSAEQSCPKLPRIRSGFSQRARLSCRISHSSSALFETKNFLPILIRGTSPLAIKL